MKNVSEQNGKDLNRARLLPWGSLSLYLLSPQSQHSSVAALLANLLSVPDQACFAGQPSALYRPYSWTQDVDYHAISLLNLIVYNVTITTSTNALLLRKCKSLRTRKQFCKCIMFFFFLSTLERKKYILFALCLSNSWSAWLPCSFSFPASCKYLEWELPGSLLNAKLAVEDWQSDAFPIFRWVT